ncbi:MAG: hypothetical protein ABI361_12940 [Nitrososphaera sp.]|jgi:branched-subunit amino acid transport protein
MPDISFALVMNLLGLGISVFISRFAFAGYAAVGSPNLLRLTFAFISISAGFAIIVGSLFVQPAYSQPLMTAGLAAQTIGYFFIALSHGLKKSFDFAPAPRFAFIPLALTPFIIPGNSIEHLIRSISFILLVYVSIETMAAYMQSRKTSTLMIGSGLGLLATAELIAWYDFIYPGIFAYPALAIKVAGFGLLFIPFSKFGLSTGLGKVNSQIGSGV